MPPAAMKTRRFDRSEADYPVPALERLGRSAPPYLYALGDTALLDNRFLGQGLDAGAGMVLLLAGPVTSYGMVFVLRKMFGMKILLLYLSFISAASIVLGYLFSIWQAYYG